MSSLLAALRYFAVVFAAGFVLGTVRSLWLAPQIGELAAVACELPLMLGVSWWWARRMQARWPWARRTDALATGLLALAFLLGAELALFTAFTGQGARAWLAALAQPAGALGLAGQALFALIPALVWRRAG